MQRVIVSGCTGHLGHEIARQLCAAGVEVHGLTRTGGANVGETAGLNAHVVDGSTETLIRIFEAVRPDIVFHVASLYRREHDRSDVTPLVAANVLYGTQLLEAARVVGCTRFLAAASFFQHFGSDEYRPLNLYAATKQAFEDILAYYVDAFGLSAAVLTLYEVYSEWDKRQKFMRAIANSLASGELLNLPGPEFWIDLVHVEDVASAFLHVASALESGEMPRGLHRYCACSGQDVAASRLVEAVERLSGQKLNVRRGAFPVPERNMSRPWRGTQVPGWAPRVGLEEGIGRMIDSAR